MNSTSQVSPSSYENEEEQAYVNNTSDIEGDVESPTSEGSGQEENSHSATLSIVSRPVPSATPPTNKNPDEQFAWLMFTRDNNKPDPYGDKSTESGPLPLNTVAQMYAQRYGGTATQQAISKRLKNQNNLRKFRLSYPDYPEKITYGHTTGSNRKSEAKTAGARANPNNLSRKRKAETDDSSRKRIRLDREEPDDDEAAQNEAKTADARANSNNLSRKRKAETHDSSKKRIRLDKEEADDDEAAQNDSEEEDSETEDEDEDDGECDVNAFHFGTFHPGWNPKGIYRPPKEIVEQPYFPEDSEGNPILPSPEDSELETEAEYCSSSSQDCSEQSSGESSDDDEHIQCATNTTVKVDKVKKGAKEKLNAVSNPRCRINGSPVRYVSYPLYIDNTVETPPDDDVEPASLNPLPENPRRRINGSPVRYYEYPLFFDHSNE